MTIEEKTADIKNRIAQFKLKYKVRKEKELEFYTKELYRIQQRIAHLNSDLNLTKLIIEMIETEQVKDIKEYMLEKKDEQQR